MGFDGVKNREMLIVRDYAQLAMVVKALQSLGMKVVVTIGTYDMLHIGHARYIREAKARGDVLIVGADSDRAVKIYKDETRPIIPEMERLEMLLHTLYPDFVTIIDDVDETGKWQYELLKAIRPDIFVAVEDSYPPEQIEDIREFVGEVVILNRQAPTSSSEIARKSAMARNQPLAAQLHSLASQLESGELS